MVACLGGQDRNSVSSSVAPDNFHEKSKEISKLIYVRSIYKLWKKILKILQEHAIFTTLINIY